MDAGTPARALREWSFEVVAAFRVGARMQRVLLTSADIRDFSYRAGQALRLQLPLPGGGVAQRDYTIRNLDPDRGVIAVDVFLHGETPGPSWALNAKPGQKVSAIGPRSRIYAASDCAFHVFCGDETCIPAILHMLEGLDGGVRAQAFIEVGSIDDTVDVELSPGSSIRWLIRGSPGETELVRCLDDLDIPEGRVHIYLIGETSVVRRQRQALLARGVSKDSISAEGYWRPGRIGGNDLIRDV